MNSPNFLKVYEVQLDKDDDKAFFIPRGFLHGFTPSMQLRESKNVITSTRHFMIDR